MATFDVNEIVQALHAVRDEWRDAQRRSCEPGGREFPSREALTQITEQLKGALFPMRLGPYDLRQESEDFYVAHTLDTALHALLAQIILELKYSARHDMQQTDAVQEQALKVTQAFALALPQIRRLLDSDVLAAYRGDPAARSVDEVLLCYPGILAMLHHRLAHHLYRQGLPPLARIVAELARLFRGARRAADEVLGLIEREASLTAIEAARLANGHAITDEIKTRLLQAAARLQHSSQRASHLQHTAQALQAAAHTALGLQQARVQTLQQRWQQALGQHLQAQRQALHSCSTSLRLLHPQHILDRGFALLQDGQGRVLSRRAQFKLGQAVQATVSDGALALTPVAQQADFDCGL